MLYFLWTDFRGGIYLATRATLYSIRRNVEETIGQKVMLKTNKGRKKFFTREGIVDETYSNVFIVRVNPGEVSERKVAYSYSDILTSTVEVTVCDSCERIAAS